MNYRPLKIIFSRKHRQSKKQKKSVEIQHSYRPYFTYWITFVQILVCIVSLIVYGHAPLTSTQSVIIEESLFVCLRVNVFVL
jgi:hypothetical protein